MNNCYNIRLNTISFFSLEIKYRLISNSKFEATWELLAKLIIICIIAYTYYYILKFKDGNQPQVHQVDTIKKQCTTFVSIIEL